MTCCTTGIEKCVGIWGSGLSLAAMQTMKSINAGAGTGVVNIGLLQFYFSTWYMAAGYMICFISGIEKQEGGST